MTVGSEVSVLGVSVVVCCHNSALRLRQTLEHLLRQHVSSILQWEVLIIDNRSNDETVTVAKSCWDSEVIPLRIIREERIGLSHARARGFAEAKFTFVSFVDDDNWVNPHFVQNVYQIFVAHNDVGCCGGPSEPVFESEPPSWFKEFQEPFACGQRGNEPGLLTGHYLWGAGLSIRKRAYLQLRAMGFRSALADRQGTRLTSGGDTELICALLLGGWTQWYDPGLGIRHFMPVSRISWSYLRRLNRAIGVSSVSIHAYLYSLFPPESFADVVRRSWIWMCVANVRELLRYRSVVMRCRQDLMEGTAEVLAVEMCLGVLAGLVRQWATYDFRTWAVRRQCRRWRQPLPSLKNVYKHTR